MKIVQTSIDAINTYRKEYLNSLPNFQELFIELMIPSSDYYIFQEENNQIGYTIKNNDGVLIEFYVLDKYIPSSNEFFRKVLKDLSITDVYCKSFDTLLLSNCMLHNLQYTIIGCLYRDYVEPLIKKDVSITMKKADILSIGLLLGQDESIKELFESEQQLIEFVKNENVFEFYKNDEFVGCGMAIKTHPDWDFCDLGVWVSPSRRGNSIGSQILLNLREFAMSNNLNPSCGCAIENVASQKTIEKSGYVSRHKMINFAIH